MPIVPLAVTCTPGTKNVGDAATVVVTIRNNGQVDLPAGVFVVVVIEGTGTWCEFVTIEPIVVGGTHVVHCQIPSIPIEWGGNTYSATVDVWETEEETNLLAHDRCDNLLAVNPGVPSAEVVSMQVL